MASGDVGGGGAEILLMDEAYEFSAPRFFDFINGEAEEDIKRAELWFETSLSYAPSRTFLRSGFVIVASVVVFSFVPRIREGRSTQIDSLCDFGNVEKEQKSSSFKGFYLFVQVSEVERCQNNIVPQQETSFSCNSSTSVAITGSLSDKEVPLELPIALSGGTPAAELETAHRVRAVRIKSSAELEEEMLAKIPKFKARPLNKKLSLHSESSNHEKKEVPRITIPNPFHLHTEVCEHCLLMLAFQFLIKEKELRYKRLREEQESAKMIEEEKAVKQMRRTMVPHARPLPKFNNPLIPQK
ncbi:hypothetical protein B296_00029117 [Ensete ventricosum]|uniref:TPX2 C-terminal domain-containing protein n=1 Tax=Ensete ventricosum TaxID=4639 RepID=A0A426Z553_ENSVE|nr:hypothetical protein B296_00029117 [Ensete ventricosum]